MHVIPSVTSIWNGAKTLILAAFQNVHDARPQIDSLIQVGKFACSVPQINVFNFNSTNGPLLLYLTWTILASHVKRQTCIEKRHTHSPNWQTNVRCQTLRTVIYVFSGTEAIPRHTSHIHIFSAHKQSAHREEGHTKFNIVFFSIILFFRIKIEKKRKQNRIHSVNRIAHRTTRPSIGAVINCNDNNVSIELTLNSVHCVVVPIRI